MRVNRSAHKGNFTVLPNEILQNSGLRYGCRGLLAFLLSLSDGRWMPAEEMARRSGDSLTNVRRYLRELTAAGYYTVRPTRVAKGHLISVQHVTDVAWKFPSLQVAPTAGKPEPGPRALLKTKKQEQETPLPPHPPEPPAIPRQRTRSAPRPPATRPPAPVLDERARAAADVLLRVVHREPRLRIGEAEAARLAPLVVVWTDRGSTPADLAAALLPGLPEQVGFPAGFIRRRLIDKLPAVLAPPAPAPTCDDCRAPVPRPGLCPPCTQAPTPSPTTSADRARAIARAAVRATREARSRTPAPAAH
ncbi:hypothetical protein ACFC6L_22360 [Kitasatospora phosalacinea]|uniref:hypothetical protein n=1 Tax=Kitasatospora phosalacinea TaxID=2065 RepID=UPI0035D69AF4